ncbi:MAG: hypothetical protein RLZZ173_1066, partial [Pseudomonadota bacterium]
LNAGESGKAGSRGHIHVSINGFFKKKLSMLVNASSLLAF